MRILIVSSMTPEWSSNLGYDLAKFYIEQGHEVVFLSKHPSRQPESWMRAVYPPVEPKAKLPQSPSLVYRCKSIAYKAITCLAHKPELPPIFNHFDEDKPPVPVDKLIAPVKGEHFDRVIVLFWWGMLSAMSLKALYDEFHCPLILHGIDMSIMTGGCNYFGECRNFKFQCQGCPSMRFTGNAGMPHRNFLTKKDVYSHIEMKVLVNTWMREHYLSTGLFKPEQLLTTTFFVDEDFFHPVDRARTRALWHLPNDKFVILCGASKVHEPRKGLQHLPAIFSRFAGDPAVAKNCLLLVVGWGNFPELGIDTRFVGTVPPELLAELYALSDLYISPSLDDAGPSMVNQALMCGTPVVAYDMGTAVDVVHTGITGYRARYADTADFADGMLAIYNHPDREQLRRQSREQSLRMNSFKARAKDLALAIL